MYTLAIIGRPNVGKSTFFNKLARKKLAIVDDRPGVTRDWRETLVEIDGTDWIIVDTAGLENATDDSVEGRMRRQTEMAIDFADALVMMIDARVGLTPTDEYFAKLVRKTGKPVVLVANKCEGREAEAGVLEAYSLGLGEPIALSAEHGHGMGDFIDQTNAIYAHLREVKPLASDFEDEEEENEFFSEDDIVEGDMEDFIDAPIDEDEIIEDELIEEKSIKLAIVGRPNVGKSTLVNALLGEERMMTGPEAGVTRDSITTQWEYNERKIRLVDTAGLRKRAKIYDPLEKTMAHETMRAVRLAHVVALVIDGTVGVDRQDLIIARHIVDEGRALIILVNKWDAMEDKNELLKEIGWRFEDSLAQVKDLPIVPISALREKNLDKFMDGVLEVYRLWNKRISTAHLNRWLSMMVQAHPSPLVNGRPNKVKYMTQAKSRPPTFLMWVARPDELPESYQRYITNGLRERYNLPAVPIRLHLKKSQNPFANRAKK